MLPAPIPPGDEARVAALHSYRLLDQDAPCFNDVVRRAADIFSVPMAVLSLVDRDRQHLQSAFGVPRGDTPRSVAFCGYTILDDHPMVVEDASRDVRFTENPLVIGAPGIRFYAGAPLVMRGGFRLGSLCALGPAPRRATALELKQLLALARLAVARMELHRTRYTLGSGGGAGVAVS